MSGRYLQDPKISEGVQKLPEHPIIKKKKTNISTAPNKQWPPNFRPHSSLTKRTGPLLLLLLVSPLSLLRTKVVTKPNYTPQKINIWSNQREREIERNIGQQSMMESTPTFIPPLLLRNFLTTLFLYADKPLLTLSQKYKLLHFLRALLISSFLFLLRLLPSLLPPDHQTHQYHHHHDSVHYPTTNSPKSHNSYPPAPTTGTDSGIARALSQLLSIVNDIPVSSRKYELVRSLAERIIDENLMEGSEALIEVNCSVLSAAFSRTLGQLEAAVLDRARNNVYPEPGPTEEGTGEAGASRESYRKVSRVFKAVRFYGDAAWTRLGRRRREAGLLRTGGSAEKLAAEVLWLAQKMAACGCVEEAVVKWASATHLAWLGLSAEPRLQGSLVKVSAFLFKQAKNLGAEEGDEGKKEQQKQTKMRMLMSWLPLLCRASNGTDAPVLSINERAELERVLEETIETLEQEEEQEKVLSLWLHHYTYCPSSDWPNLHACYARWCSASRKLLLLH